MTELFSGLAAGLSDRYTIERELGRGGMAVVYLAEDVKHGRHLLTNVADWILESNRGEGIPCVAETSRNDAPGSAVRENLVVRRCSQPLSSRMDEQLEFVRQIAARLESAGIEYMMTGSMAMALYATPRMTRDVDLVVEVDESDVDTLVALFEPDCYIDRVAVSEAVTTRGMFNIIHSEWVIKADFIVRKPDAYRRTEFERRRQIDVEGTALSVVAPEDLILSKLQWAEQTQSELQRRDVREIVARVSNLDWDYLGAWSARLGMETTLNGLRSP